MPWNGTDVERIPKRKLRPLLREEVLGKDGNNATRRRDGVHERYDLARDRVLRY